MKNRMRHTLDEIQRNTFYQMPKFLFEEEFDSISTEAIVLYSLLRDRHDLSTKNQWINENGEIYLLFTREELCKLLRKSENTVLKAMNNLKKLNLVEEERQGLGRPNKIYLLTVINLDNSKTLKLCGSGASNLADQTLKLCGSGTSESAGQDPQDLRPNDTDLNQLICNDTEINHIESNQGETESETDIKTDMIREDKTAANDLKNGQKNKASLESASSTRDKHISKLATPRYMVSEVEQIIKDNIEYDTLIKNKTVGKETLDEIVYAIVNTICNDYRDGYITLGEERVVAEVVRSTFFKLNMFDIEYFVECYNRQTEPITKLTPYIRKSLFYNHGTISHHYSNRVNVDMPHMSEWNRLSKSK